jgi:hypothetical protein
VVVTAQCREKDGAVNTRDEERERDERAAIERFLYQLRATASYRDAIQLAERRPAKGEPGRAMHGRFNTFLQSLEMPGGAGLEEAIEYARLFDCFVVEGAVWKDTVEQLRSELQRSVASRRGPVDH